MKYTAAELWFIKSPDAYKQEEKEIIRYLRFYDILFSIGIYVSYIAFFTSAFLISFGMATSSLISSSP